MSLLKWHNCCHTLFGLAYILLRCLQNVEIPKTWVCTNITKTKPRRKHNFSYIQIVTSVILQCHVTQPVWCCALRMYKLTLLNITLFVLVGIYFAKRDTSSNCVKKLYNWDVNVAKKVQSVSRFLKTYVHFSESWSKKALCIYRSKQRYYFLMPTTHTFWPLFTTSGTTFESDNDMIYIIKFPFKFMHHEHDMYLYHNINDNIV